MSKSKAEIIQETIDWYAADPDNRRAVSIGGDCKYSTAEGSACCAVGRVLNDPWKAECEYGGDPAENIPEEWFLPEYRGHHMKFWVLLQNLHDLRVHWTTDGISDHGIEKLLEITEEFEIPDHQIQIPGTDKTLEDYA